MQLFISHRQYGETLFKKHIMKTTKKITKRQIRQKIRETFNPETLEMAAGQPGYANVATELQQLADDIRAGHVVDEAEIFQRFAEIQAVLDAHGRAVGDTSGQVHENKTRSTTMKITKSKLRQLIKEEIQKVLQEYGDGLSYGESEFERSGGVDTKDR